MRSRSTHVDPNAFLIRSNTCQIRRIFKYIKIRADTCTIRYQIRSWIRRLFRYVRIRIRYKQDTSYLRVRLEYASDTHEYIPIQHKYFEIQANTPVFVACCCTNAFTAPNDLTCGAFWPVPRAPGLQSELTAAPTEALPGSRASAQGAPCGPNWPFPAGLPFFT